METDRHNHIELIFIRIFLKQVYSDFSAYLEMSRLIRHMVAGKTLTLKAALGILQG